MFHSLRFEKGSSLAQNPKCVYSDVGRGGGGMFARTDAGFGCCRLQSGGSHALSRMVGKPGELELSLVAVRPRCAVDV